MLGTTHIIFGMLFALPFYMGWGEGDLVLFGFAILGSLLPDFDHPKSLISKINPMAQFVSRGISKLTPHRKHLHTLIAAVVAFIVTALLALYFSASLLYPFFLFIGYISHLAADSLNPTGIQWLMPFRERKVNWKIRTGTQHEKVVLVLILFLLVFIGLWQMGFFEPYS